MKRRKLITVAALAALALACSESVGGMLEDAGQMLVDAGDIMQPDAGAQDTVQCRVGSDGESFAIDNPGETEITVCFEAGFAGYERAHCQRYIAPYFQGTKQGFAYSCNGVTSVTVHN